MRDTIVSLGLNRPPRVKDSDFDVASLTPDDFDFHVPQNSGAGLAAIQDTEKQHQLASTCIAMASICLIIGRIFTTAYTESASGHIAILYSTRGAESPQNALEYRQAAQVDIASFDILEEQLRQWKFETPKEALHLSPTPSPSLKHEQAPLLHRALVSMLYFTALTVLHRARATLENPPVRLESPNGQDHPRHIVRAAAYEVNKIVMDLYQADLMRYIPATGISCLVSISRSHICDMRSTNPTIRREGRQRLEECKQALRELTDAHIAAEWAVNLFTYVDSHIKSQGTTSRRLLGTASGEVQLTGQGNQQNLCPAKPPQPKEHITGKYTTGTSLSNVVVAGTPDMPQTFSTAPISAHLAQLFEPARYPAVAPDTSSDLMDFSEMWLDFTAGFGEMPENDWIDSTDLAMSLHE